MAGQEGADESSSAKRQAGTKTAVVYERCILCGATDKSTRRKPCVLCDEMDALAEEKPISPVLAKLLSSNSGRTDHGRSSDM
jgi:hypothetical protein